MRVAFGADHAGFELKQHLLETARRFGHEKPPAIVESRHHRPLDERWHGRRFDREPGWNVQLAGRACCEPCRPGSAVHGGDHQR